MCVKNGYGETLLYFFIKKMTRKGLLISDFNLNSYIFTVIKHLSRN